MIPSVSTWRTPPLPRRVKRACFSRYASASLIAAWWAASIFSAIPRGAIAHSVDTDFAGENVRSTAARAVLGGRRFRAIHPDNSVSVFGARSCSAVNIRNATSVRMRSSTSSGTFASRGLPCSMFQASTATAHSRRKSGRSRYR
nr:hypothetical protein [Nocardia sp. CY41]